MLAKAVFAGFRHALNFASPLRFKTLERKEDRKKKGDLFFGMQRGGGGPHRIRSSSVKLLQREVYDRLSVRLS